MNYEQKYKDALESAKGIINYYKEHNRGDESAIEDLEIIFPELKESEDKRIKKELTKFLKNASGGFLDTTIQCKTFGKWAAWLEKQGEQKVPINDFKAKNWYVSEVDGKIHDMTYNPTDKVEPKFKVGDWIVNDYCSGKVIALTDDAYLLDSGQGIPFSCEHNVHLWTIADAKDGDVLYSLDSNRPFIYKERKQNEQAIAYCGLNIYGKFFVWDTKDCVITLNNYVPATKEQRDLLFKKIEEAGYQWDAEKKELKKIEQKPVNDTVETIVETVSNTSILDMIEDKDAFTNPGAFENSLGRLLKLFEKLPKQDLLDGLKFYTNVVEHDGEYVKATEWSEDDERIVTALMEGFRYHQLFNPKFGEVPNAEIISWIKSLKERLS